MMGVIKVGLSGWDYEGWSGAEQTPDPVAENPCCWRGTLRILGQTEGADHCESGWSFHS